MFRRTSLAYVLFVSASFAWAGCANGTNASDTGDVGGGTNEQGGTALADSGSTSSDASAPSGDNESITPVDAGSSNDAGTITDDAGPATVDAGKSDAGATSVASAPAQGEVLITEVMYDPSGAEPDGEWFEVTNLTSSSKLLSGLTIEDGSARTHVIGAGVSLAPGAIAVLARSKSAAVAAQIPASVILYEYGAGLASSSGVQLANGATGGVSLRAGSTVISQVTYGGWYTASGASLQMIAPYKFASGTSKSGFCVSGSAFAGGVGADLGTPGVMNDCP